MFCDLVGSTELTERIDAEAVHGVMSRYWQAMREVVERHGGRVEKFIGDAVVAMFGVPHLHEDDGLRAVRTAAGMRDALEPLNEELEARWGVRIQIRAGVATGEVVASSDPGGPSVTGSALNLAARLEAACPPGEVLLDEETWRLVRTSAEGEPETPLELKGFEGAIRPVRLLRLLPTELPGRPEPPFVGRETELALLRDLRDDTRRTRRCRVVTISGDAGIGKTRLVREFADREAGEDTVLLGRCRAYGEGAALGPVGEALLRGLHGESAADPCAEVEALLADRGDAEAVASAFCAAVGLLDGAVTPDEASSAVRTALESLARRTPLVLVLDDVQWAEPALLDCVQHVAEWSREAPMLIVCLARPDLLEARPSWGRAVGDLTIRLRPLTEDQGRTLARALRADGGELERVVEAAGGNPFFLEELVASLRDDEGVDGAPHTIPATISALLASRIDHLSPAEQETLRIAAVLGPTFDGGMLGRLAQDAGGDADEAAEALRTLALRDFLGEAEHPGSYRFRHELTREAAYAAIPKVRRAELHEAAAGLLASAEPGTEHDALVGLHLERARGYLTELGPALGARADALGSTAARHLARAGRAAIARGDVMTAASTLERAGALLHVGDEERGPILADLHDALLYAGDTERAGAAVAMLLDDLGPDATGTLAERARMQHALLRFLEDPNAIPRETLRAELDRAIEAFEAAGDLSDLATAYATRSVIGWLEGSAAAMQADAERGLALARGTGNRRAMTDAVATLGAALIRGPVPLESVERRLTALVEELAGDRLTQAAARLDLATTLALRGWLDRATAEAEQARDTLRDLGQRRWLARCTDTLAEIASRRGEGGLAVELLRSVHATFVEQGDEVNARPSGLALAEALLDVGEDEEADALAAEVEREAPQDDLETQIVWRSVRARVAARRGEGDRATRLAEDADTLARSTDWVLLHADTRGALAEVLDMLARPQAAAVRAEALELFRRKGAVARLPGPGA